MNRPVLRVAVVFGTRPEAIKMAPLVRALRDDPRFELQLVVTAQHRQMLDQVLSLFEIVPDVDLDLMSPGQSLPELTARALTALCEALSTLRPDLVLVHGDTTTTFVASLAAFYLQLPVGHVEAGLRTFDKYAPWPEEMNRQLTGRLAELHFAPTQTARQNLLQEGLSDDAIEVTGNTVIDALQWVVAELDRRIAEGFDPLSLFSDPALELSSSALESIAQLAAPSGERRMVLVTGHRRESFGEGFEAICTALRQAAERYPEVAFIYPVHLNPAVREPVYRLLEGLHNVHLLPPLDYLPFVYLLRAATLVLTDSGGLQEEAPGLGKPVLVMREKSERMEAVEAGTVELLGTSTERIVSAISRLLDDPAAYAKMARANNPYGDGHATERIVERLARQSTARSS